MDEIKEIGNIQLLTSIYDVEFVSTGAEGDLGLLLFGDKMSSHVLSMPPGFYPPHSHEIELLILCVKGECEVFQGSGELRGQLKPLSIIWVPANEEIGVEVKGDAPCDIVVVAAPKRMERAEFYERLRKP